MEAKTWTQGLQEPGGKSWCTGHGFSLPASSSRLCSACFLTESRGTGPEWYHPQWAGPCHISHWLRKRQPHQWLWNEHLQVDIWTKGYTVIHGVTLQLLWQDFSFSFKFYFVGEIARAEGRYEGTGRWMVWGYMMWKIQRMKFKKKMFYRLAYSLILWMFSSSQMSTVCVSSWHKTSQHTSDSKITD